MKNLFKYLTAFVIPATILLVGCADEDMNFDKKKIKEEETYAKNFHLNAYITSLQNNIDEVTTSWMYQVQENLNADLYAGYMMSANPFGRGGDNTNYSFIDGWNGFIYSVPSTTLSTFMDLEKKCKTVKVSADYYAMGLIMKVISVHRMIDAFGPFPYTHYGEGIGQAWDDVPEIYDAFFAELNTAIDSLSKLVGTDYENRISGDYDISSFGGNTVQWIKLANTLKLRLALRISDVSPEKAKSIAEAACSNEYGLLEAPADAFIINHSYTHPFYNISQSWKDIQMGSDIESFMGGYNDPRLPVYFSPAADLEVLGQFKGIRSGIVRVEKTTYQDYSLVNVQAKTPLLIITAAESHFLRAEAALKGWNVGGTAKDFYESGIRTSFDERKVGGIEDYLVSAATPKNFVDTKNTAYNYAATTLVTPNWDDAATDDQRLEKIITQKWIAIFPDGAEAWAEFRRTGYPKLVPIYEKQNDAIPDGEFVKRIPYPSAITSPSGSAYTDAINNFLGGVDSPNTKLWWDVE